MYGIMCMVGRWTKIQVIPHKIEIELKVINYKILISVIRQQKADIDFRPQDEQIQAERRKTKQNK